MDEASFREALKHENFAEPVDFIKEPNWADTEHSHDFDVFAFVVEGELTIEKKSGDVVCQVGDTVRYPAGKLHTEKAGPNGVKALVGRRPEQP
jgi:mannose-6-phosphate isomerase-like protein (cupin superfamily)